MPPEVRSTRSRSASSGAVPVDAREHALSQSDDCACAAGEPAEAAEADDAIDSVGANFAKLTQALLHLRHDLETQPVNRSLEGVIATIHHLEIEIARAREFAMPVPGDIVRG